VGELRRARVTFNRCIQDSSEAGSDEEFMVSRVFFTLETGGRGYRNLYANLKQTVGCSCETGPIEVGAPVGYDGPFNYSAFRDAAERYYRSLVGSQRTGIGTEGSGNVRMRNNTFNVEMQEEFDVEM
jgi:hypothetical protein